jgi:L-ornithine N5-monooxygenase
MLVTNKALQPSSHRAALPLAERRADEHVHDVIGIGFGPANLALAAAIRERAACESAVGNVHFLEQRRHFSWQSGMLLADSRMQSCFLEDLVTGRNPQSRFTFINYLKEKGRLFEFMNLRDFYPTRNEFNDYLTWVAEHFADWVSHSARVLAVEPVPKSGKITHLRVTAENLDSANRTTYNARNLVIATGRFPFYPEGIPADPGGRVVHSSEFIHRIPAKFPDKAGKHRFLIAGSGQSAADIFSFLLKEYPNADISIVFRQFSFRPFDDTCFLNELFHPDFVNFIYGVPSHKRHYLDETYKRANYSVVDERLIHAIYRTLYEERVAGRERARIFGFSELRGVDTCGTGRVRAEINRIMAGETLYLDVDAVILATGYRKLANHPLLDSIERYLLRNDLGQYQIGRNYRIAAAPELCPAIFVQGWSEETHGVGDTLIPILSTRSAEIVEGLSGALWEQSRQISPAQERRATRKSVEHTPCI